MTSSPPGMPLEDYEAIEAAVMETARGRWFLMEFARRNRTADTRVLLEALARLEDQITRNKHAPPTPHQPVASTAVVSSAAAELFAVEPPSLATAVSLLALPEPPELTWVDEPKIDMDRPIQPDIFELDDDLILSTESTTPPPPPAVSSAPPAPAAPPRALVPSETSTGEPRTSETKPAETKLAEAAQPAQSRMLAGALAQAEEAMARASEPAPPPPPTAFSPPPADPAELDALSFEEKSVYFG